MEFTILFLAVAVVMVAAWWGTRTFALALVRCDTAGLHCDLSAPRERRPEAVILNRPMTRSLAITLNALGLYAIALILLVAFGAQLILQELPCPLCLLQRIQFAMLAVVPILNLRFRPP